MSSPIAAPTRVRPRVVLVLVALAAAVLQVVHLGGEAGAISADQWRAGNIISNNEFFAGSAMSASEVQTFLATKGASCVDGSEKCLKNYSTSTPSTPSEAGLCDAMPATSSSSGAQIIYNVGKACGISQQVILVMIQKESSIVTTGAPTKGMYQATAGFACPDTAPCDAQYYGFFNQVYRMARQFKYYAANPTRYGYQAGRNNTILYNPTASCGSGTVYIENQATANLYIYTPYQPNKAALANLYGTGDSCSAYGNRNFWRFYNDWFKTAEQLPQIDPQGSLESVTPGNDGDLRVRGWVFDGSQPIAPVSVRITVNGQLAATVSASRPRPELAYYGIPGDHGYDSTVKGIVHGGNTVCVTALNIDGGKDVQLGCITATATFNPIDPIGALESAVPTSTGEIAVKGWVYDGSAWNTPVSLIYAVNGQIRGYGSANQARPELSYYGIPGDHGFSGVVQGVANGPNRICVYAANILGGTDREIGCKSVSLTIPGSPVGAVESVSQDGHGNVTVPGYAFDPDAPLAAVIAVVSVNGEPIAYLYADKPKPELAYYGVPGNHGFSWTFKPTVTGVASICTYAANIGAGADNSLGCKSLDIVAPGSPIGDFESLTLSGGKLSMSGWAWDPNVPLAPVVMMVTVNGQVNAYLYADRPKHVLGAYGIPGDHGFTWSTAAPRGSSNEVCVFAFNQGEGQHRLLGCRTA